MARKFRRPGRTRTVIRYVGRAARSGARAVGSRARSVAREHKDDLEGMALGTAIGGIAGYVEADRVLQGKAPGFSIGSDTDDTKNHHVTIGNIAGLGGAAIALSTRNRKTANLASHAGGAGGALSAYRWAYNFRTSKGKQ